MSFIRGVLIVSLSLVFTLIISFFYIEKEYLYTLTEMNKVNDKGVSFTADLDKDNKDEIVLFTQSPIKNKQRLIVYESNLNLISYVDFDKKIIPDCKDDILFKDYNSNGTLDIFKVSIDTNNLYLTIFDAINNDVLVNERKFFTSDRDFLNNSVFLFDTEYSDLNINSKGLFYFGITIRSEGISRLLAYDIELDSIIALTESSAYFDSILVTDLDKDKNKEIYLSNRAEGAVPDKINNLAGNYSWFVGYDDSLKLLFKPDTLIKAKSKVSILGFEKSNTSNLLLSIKSENSTLLKIYNREGVFKGNKGSLDVFIGKTPKEIKYSTNEIDWINLFGGSQLDNFTKIIQLEGSFYVAGYSTSQTDYLNTKSFGYYDGTVTKFDAFGNIIWNKRFGGNKSDRFYDINYINNEIIVSGTTNSTNIKNGSNTGGFDIYIVRLDTLGNLIADFTFSSQYSDKLKSINYEDNKYVLGIKSHSPSDEKQNDKFFNVTLKSLNENSVLDTLKFNFKEKIDIKNSLKLKDNLKII